MRARHEGRVGIAPAFVRLGMHDLVPGFVEDLKLEGREDEQPPSVVRPLERADGRVRATVSAPEHASRFCVLHPHFAPRLVEIPTRMRRKVVDAVLERGVTAIVTVRDAAYGHEDGGAAGERHHWHLSDLLHPFQRGAR